MVQPNSRFEVIGGGIVTVLSSETLGYSNYQQARDREPLVIEGIRVGFLPPGTSFDLEEWSVVATDLIARRNNV